MQINKNEVNRLCLESFTLIRDSIVKNIEFFVTEDLIETHERIREYSNDFMIGRMIDYISVMEEGQDFYTDNHYVISESVEFGDIDDVITEIELNEYFTKKGVFNG